MLAERRLIIMLGLSRGGTNHLAQRLHACCGVAGFTEGMSRLIHPTRDERRQIVRREAVESAVLKPAKPAFDCPVWSFNKVNYALQVYPEAWIDFLNKDGDSRTLILLRHPLMIHQSRVRYVREKKPQRVRWLDPAQLAREWLELLAAAWRISNAAVVFHEHALVDNHDAFLRQTLDLVPEAAHTPTHCPACRDELARRPRHPSDPQEWLFCPRCDRFVEGEGDYNFLRSESDAERYRESEREALSQFGECAGTLGAAIGREAVQFFADGRHWLPDAPTEFQSLLNASADRWRSVPMNEILYPY